jgi:hypothetical protein
MRHFLMHALANNVVLIDKNRIGVDQKLELWFLWNRKNLDLVRLKLNI